MDSLKDNLLYILKKVKGNENTLISSGWPECLWTPNIDFIEDIIEALDKERAEHANIIECYEAMKSGVAVRIGDLEEKNADLQWELDKQKTRGKMLKTHIDLLTRSS
jgi:hypothetical protein